MGELGPMDMQLTLQPRYALLVEFSETLTVSIYNRRLDTKCSVGLFGVFKEQPGLQGTLWHFYHPTTARPKS